MELVGQQRIAAPIDKTWVALNDPGVLKECITGCDSIERVSDNEYQVGISVKIGPVNAKFKGKLMLDNVVPPSSYKINFEGQGGVAGFGKGSADVKLSPDGAGTLLDYACRAQVGGKIAQIGSRLVDSAAKKMADDFFAAFNAKMGGSPQDSSAPASDALASHGNADVATGAAAAKDTALAVPSPAKGGGMPTWAWIVVAAIVILALVRFCA